MDLSLIAPFEEALKALAARDVLPTALDSQGLRQLGAGFHRQNFTSSQTLLTDLLDEYKSGIEAILNPTTGVSKDRETAQNPEGFVTVGRNAAQVRLAAKQLLQDLGYTAAPGEQGTIKDLSSNARINLVIQTNKDISQGAGWFIQSQDPAALDAFPAQELVRIEGRKEPRDWRLRWEQALAAAGDAPGIAAFQASGRMIARKDSGVWQALGDGAGGYDDSLGNPFPPFAFQSGMGVRDIGYDEALALNLIQAGEAVRPQLPADLASLFGMN